MLPELKVDTLQLCGQNLQCAEEGTWRRIAVKNQENKGLRQDRYRSGISKSKSVLE